MEALHNTEKFWMINKENRKESMIELSCEQKERVLNLINESLQCRVGMVNDKLKMAVKLNVVCCIIMAIILKTGARPTTDMILNGIGFGDLCFFFALFLVSLSVNALRRFCICPLFELYFGDLAKLKKYVNRGKVSVIKDSVPQDNGMSDTLSDIKGLTTFKLMLLERGVMYSGRIAMRKFKKCKEGNKKIGGFVMFQDIDSLAKQMESGERLMLCCSPVGVRHKIMFATSL